MSRSNGEKARAAIELKRRTARRIKERELRAKLLAAAPQPKKSVVEKIVKSKPVEKVADTVKKAGEALAELAEMAKPKKTRKPAAPKSE